MNHFTDLNSDEVVYILVIFYISASRVHLLNVYDFNSDGVTLQTIYFGSKRDSSLRINCENFTIGCIVYFRAILHQRLALPLSN